jgi:hypothetical protein
VQKRRKLRSFSPTEAPETLARKLGLSAVPRNGLLGCARSAVVKKARSGVHHFCEAESPKWRRAPLSAGRFSIGPLIGKALAHVVQHEIRKRRDPKRAELAKLWMLSDIKGWSVAGRTLEPSEDLSSLSNLGSIQSPAGGDAERLCVPDQAERQTIAGLWVIRALARLGS